jgi:choline kinase
MRAIILAAGVGNRIGAAHTSAKCLLEFDGVSLLERHILTLRKLGVTDIHLCLGYEAVAILERLQQRGFVDISHEYNPLYRQGSIVSLWNMRDFLCDGSNDVLVMDADVLYHPDILSRLVNSPYKDCFLIDRNYIDGDEPVKICLRKNKIVEFGKVISPTLLHDQIGESVGFFKFCPTTAAKLKEIIARFIGAGMESQPHEEALRELAMNASYNIEVEDITGLPWIEIDYPEDIERASTEVLPKINVI